jgi:hypothetical protein
MPLTDARPGEMYCNYCVDEKGQLRPYEQKVRARGDEGDGGTQT